MGQVAGEVVGAELVLGIEPLVLQIFRPLLQLWPIAAGEIGVAFHLGDGREQDQQVAALLDRHLVLFRSLAAAIALAVGVRVLTEVVRCEGKLPTIGSRVVHERDEERLGQRRAEQQELRRHRIKHVGRADAAVRVVLLAELQRLAVAVGHELAGSEALAVGQGAQIAA